MATLKDYRVTPTPLVEERRPGLHGGEVVLIVVGLVFVLGVLGGLLREGGLNERVWRYPIAAWIVLASLILTPYLIGAVRTAWQAGIRGAERMLERDLDGGGIGQNPQVIRDYLPTVPLPEVRRLAGETRAYTPNDLRQLIHHVYSAPNWSGRGTLRGMRLHHSGQVLADYERDVAPFLELLERHGLLVGRGPGARGNLVGTEEDALRVLKL